MNLSLISVMIQTPGINMPGIQTGIGPKHGKSCGWEFWKLLGCGILFALIVKIFLKYQVFVLMSPILILIPVSVCRFEQYRYGYHQPGIGIGMAVSVEHYFHIRHAKCQVQPNPSLSGGKLNSAKACSNISSEGFSHMFKIRAYSTLLEITAN